MLVHACVSDKSQINAVFAEAGSKLGMHGLVLLGPQQITLDTLGAALDHLALLKHRFKHQLLKACLAVVTQDQEYAPREREVMRAIAAVLDCPLPLWPRDRNKATVSDPKT